MTTFDKVPRDKVFSSNNSVIIASNLSFKHRKQTITATSKKINNKSLEKLTNTEIQNRITGITEFFTDTCDNLNMLEM